VKSDINGLHRLPFIRKIGLEYRDLPY